MTATTNSHSEERARRGEKGRANEDVALHFIDPAVIERWDEYTSEDGSDMGVRLIRLFLERAPERMREIKGALDRADGGGVAQAAHRLGPSAANVGARKLHELCLVMQTNARTGLLPAAELMKALDREFEGACAELTALLAKR